MNNLYCVFLRNDQRNWSTTFLISASNETDLRLKVQALGLVGEAEEWQMTSHHLICTTPDSVEEEI